MLNLPDVTIACIDAINPQAIDLIPHIEKDISFGGSVLINTGINSVQDYNRFILNELHKYINTSHCLVVQLDGFPMNVDAWTDEFLEYDYIGAPWVNFPQMPAPEWIGNGGFSLRSKKLLDAVAELNSDGSCLEDNFICVENRKLLENKGLEFAPVRLAKKFSVENNTYTGQFGFHGKLTIEINKKVGVFR